MQTFTCLFADDRYNAPTLAFFVTSDALRARELAQQELGRNAHYFGFELCRGSELLFAEGPLDHATQMRGAA